ncbi:hypothetical protein UFOVP1646_23 [uncultured Caudovirales phage]|uniref:Uncharacterized protein n=1 Tax=uncultured Caudovirales phage TaxID=2100421 RepID=A0A6J5SP77_9CAUD|nr:hypothetical protein UFOVP1139_23 [uncultured Caudovirales phage]CAB4217079.1 hypothetical protein UFOVP1499_12 [uncultured Caudovirales phage]CAB4222290.1 hypothetical protein UFOVP1646_23 [uncultured Caudovirales phage]
MSERRDHPTRTIPGLSSAYRRPAVNSGATQMHMRVDNSAVAAALGRLSYELNEKARRVGIRRALRPFVTELRAVVGTGPYRGKNTHRKAMASAVGVTIKRGGAGAEAKLIAQMGVRYGKKGGKAARGRQGVFHLLEQGYKHGGKGSQKYTNSANPSPGKGNTWSKQQDRDPAGRWTSPRFRVARGGARRIPGSGRARSWAQSAIGRITDAMAREVLVEAKKLLGGK